MLFVACTGQSGSRSGGLRDTSKEASVHGGTHVPHLLYMARTQSRFELLPQYTGYASKSP